MQRSAFVASESHAIAMSPVVDSVNGVLHGVGIQT